MQKTRFYSAGKPAADRALWVLQILQIKENYAFQQYVQWYTPAAVSLADPQMAQMAHLLAARSNDMPRAQYPG